ncbi:oxidoreductase [Phyllobacterium phragmitis]|uniref:Oxidoreductase n=1 Tax=Phyllobacterium phragmitis TaxID=2670329 RepID=A0A2S9IRF2_9HYPH|nr:GMC family oxidoreductase N-terminal domain-containing protein [Phyllobacterium phragmitis]PRD43114.1 oxidoreductase [Phyllobacterium phragmitis]
MFETENASPAVKLALLEERLLSAALSPDDFLTEAAEAGVPRAEALDAAARFLAIAANQSRLRQTLKSSYDYIVIGSGASGSVVASRLAQRTDAQVLLLESGGSDLQPGVLIPETWFYNQTGPFDWNLAGEPAVSVNNRQVVQAAGRVLGGSTSINGMVWARGHRNDFEDWAQLSGDAEWGYDHVLDIYRRIEDWRGTPDPARRGRGGEVFVQPAPDPHPIAPAFLKAAEALGIPTFADQNGVMQEGGGGGAITNVRIRDGMRLNTTASYLYPVMDRPNLTVLTDAHVVRLVMRGKGAAGVEFDWQGERRRIDASSETIVCAGALQTPKILMLSGIGDRKDLQRFGIDSTADLPGVGRNLMDHPIIGAGLWEAHEPIPPRNNAAEANLFAKSVPDLPTPDLHLWLIEVPYLSEVTGRHAVPNSWSISPGLARPESRGSLRLKSADPRDAPEINANMLSHPRDLAALRAAMKLARDIGNSEEMKPFVKREILPGPLDDEALDNLIRDGAMSMHHPVGTARMGQDDMSVVDAQLRVHGVGKLRVADGSIMPLISTGNTQAPCVIIGERMAEILTR